MKEQKPWWHRAREKARCAFDREKSDLVIRRRSQQEAIVPVLRSMPWRKIVAGHTRIRDIDTFIKYYEMYVPLLAEHEVALENARDSGIFKGFELFASATLLIVLGITPGGNRKTVIAVTENYWEDLYTFAPHNYSPW